VSSRGLPWIRFDTTLPDHPKILALLDMRDGHRSAFVFCCALAYAGRHGTDGHIPVAALSRINGRKQDAANLVAVGLFDPDVDPSGGWHVHAYAEYQQTAEVTDEVREKRRKASRKGNCVRHHGEGCQCWKLPPADGLRAVR
jgi:hypothetical protein